MNKVRFIIYMTVAALHAALIFTLAFTVRAPLPEGEPPAPVMKLVDIREEIPLPPIPIPPPPVRRPAPAQSSVEAVAENMVAADEVPEGQIVGEIGTAAVETPALEYLPQHKIVKVPQFVDDQIRKNTVYPAIALRSGIEGTVILELFIDREGEIRQITVLKEDPPGRGFGEAARNAFKGVKALPAEGPDGAAAVRYRYPIRFKLKA
jgi:protein TonB